MRYWPAAVAVVFATAAMAACSAAEPEVPRASLELDPEDGAVVALAGLPADALRTLAGSDPVASGGVMAVYTGGAEDLADGRSAVVGRVTVGGGTARWAPEYPLREGQPYTVVWYAPDRGTWTFSLPVTVREPTTVVSAVHPATDVVPENLLRLYLQFSAPMSRGYAAEHIELVDQKGAPIASAFAIPEQELWSPDGDRLTLFFDPGRLKEGVGPNERMGAPLRAGQRITLRVSAAWPDHHGAPLRRGFERSWSVGAADRVRPDPTTWTLTAPSSGSDSVTLVLAEPLDWPQIARMIAVIDAEGREIAGSAAVEPTGRGWRFVPAGEWMPGDYALRVDPDLEDLAGNSVSRLFDEPLRADRVGTSRAPVQLPFSVATARPGRDGR